MSKGPTNDHSEAGTWGVADGSAADHATGEIVVNSSGFLDPAEGATDQAVRSARNSDPVRLPYPEATYWGRARMGSRGFTSGAVMQPTILFDAGFAIMADGGATFIQVT